MNETSLRVTYTVPDLIQRLVGARTWLATWRAGTPVLRSVYHPGSWPADRPIEARCYSGLHWSGRARLATARHTGPAPDRSCLCGIYALKSRTGLAAYPPWKGGAFSVMGIAYGWGHFIEGSEGWRAQFARCVALLGTPVARENDIADRFEVEAWLEAARDRYRIPILDDWPQEVSP